MKVAELMFTVLKTTASESTVADAVLTLADATCTDSPFSSETPIS